uniref:ERCC4 domain-containing protein n=1 Tax=Rhabditophanes sp. KR3021 TaxID=114890 RepID=A0AC35TK37_9BILA
MDDQMETDADVQVVLEENVEVPDEEDKIRILDYEMNYLATNLEKSTMFVMSDGLCVERLFLNELLTHSSHEKLILILNLDEYETLYFIEELKSVKADIEPRNAGMIVKRERLYVSGGAVFIKSQPLIMDILQGVLDPQKIKAVFVYNCGSVHKNDNIVHAIQRIKTTNPGCWIKLFTDNVRSLYYNQSLPTLQSFYDSFRLKNVEFGCRFSDDIRECLDTNKLAISAFEYKLSKEASVIYENLVEQLIRESNTLTTIVTQYYKFEKNEEDGAYYCLHRRTGLEAALHAKSATLEPQHRNYLTNLKNMRLVIKGLINLDVVSLYKWMIALEEEDFVEEMRPTYWHKRPGFEFVKNKIKQMASKYNKQSVLVCDIPVKWHILEDILTEIKEIVKKEPGDILLLGNNSLICQTLLDLLKVGKENMIRSFAAKCRALFSKKDIDSISLVKPKLLWNEDDVEYFEENHFFNKNDAEKTLCAALKKSKSNKRINDIEAGPMSKMTKLNITTKEIVPSKLCIVQSTDRLTILKLLSTRKPLHIITYSPDLALTRTIEIYHALMMKEDKRIKLYTISNKEYELESYQTFVHNESKVFERYIKQFSTICPCRDEDLFQFFDQGLRVSSLKSKYPNVSITTDEETPLVILDSREFKSELPYELSKMGVTIKPLTIEVGDYVLSPDTVMERKALDDLTQSLHEGRIFKQFEGMRKFYKNCILLIESNDKFDAASRRAADPFKGQMNKYGRETKLKLCVLIRKNPQMKIIWMSSPRKSADFLYELKMGMLNPNPDKALSYKAGVIDTLPSGVTQSEAGPVKIVEEMQRVFAKIPSLGLKNIEEIMANPLIPNFKALANMKLDVLEDQYPDSKIASNELFKILNTDFRTINAE